MQTRECISQGWVQLSNRPGPSMLWYIWYVSSGLSTSSISTEVVPDVCAKMEILPVVLLFAIAATGTFLFNRLCLVNKVDLASV